MPVFRRSSGGATDDTAQEDSQGAQVQGAPAKDKPAAQAKKGRPTPKRSEAERDRYQSITGGRSSGTRSTAPRSGKPLTPEEKARVKSRDREERGRKMAAMKAGEEWALGPRDRGPAKRLVRDYVDSHRRPSEYYMYALIVILIALVTHNHLISSVVSYLVAALIVVIVIDGFYLRRSVHKLMAQRLPDESTRGLTYYGVMRAIQIRQWRMPAPRVKPGAKI